MFGRKSSAHDNIEDPGGFVHLNDLKETTSARLKVKTEPSRGFFRKIGQYDQLRDDASQGSPSPTKSANSATSKIDLQYLDRDSTSTVHTQRSSIISSRKSNGITDSILSRFSSREDSSECGKGKEEVKLHKGNTGGSKGGKAFGSNPRSKAGYGAVNASDMTDSPTKGTKSIFGQNGVNGHEKNRSSKSPGLLSSAAKLLGQGSKNALGRQSIESFKAREAAASDCSSDTSSPNSSSHMKPASEFRPMSDAADLMSTPPKPQRIGLRNGGTPTRHLLTGEVSPGATRPLLGASESVSPSPSPSPAVISPSPSFHTPHTNGAISHTTSSYVPRAYSIDVLPEDRWQSGAQTDPLPHRRSLPLYHQGRRYGGSHARALSESKAQRPEDSQHENGQSIRLPIEAMDIFEPRPDSSANGASEPLPRHGSKRMTQAIKNVENMTGHEALKTLEKGALLKKKWMGSANIREAPSMSKTERLIRCRMQDGKVVVHYHHKGVKGFLDKDELVTQVQRVEVVDGTWREGDCLLLHTGRGVLALSAPDAATYTTWTLGLNAALTSSQQVAGNILLEAPVRAIPRDTMFVVKDA